jgi:hypothetical protein
MAQYRRPRLSALPKGQMPEILSVLAQYGPVGPNGKLRISESVGQDTEAWSDADSTRHPDFYVVSDIWNDCHAGLE